MITFDEFHMMKMVNEAVDNVRKAEQKEAPQSMLRNENKATAKQKKRILTLKGSHLMTKEANCLKLAMQEVWTFPHVFADIYLLELMDWATRSELQPIMELAKTVKRHEDGLTNGLLEGINVPCTSLQTTSSWLP